LDSLYPEKKMANKRKMSCLVVLIAGVLLAVQAQIQTPTSNEQDVEALNAGRQKQYPDFPLDAQKAAMARIEEMRRTKRVENLRNKILPADWIQISYHGLLLDANLDVIEMTPETIGKIQESIYSVLQNSARAELLKKRGRELKSGLFVKEFKDQERLFARGLALEALLSESDQQVKARYGWRAQLLSGFTALRVTSTMSDKLAARVQQLSLPADLLQPEPPRSEYVETCRAQQVPIPPDWPNPKWISQGPLAFVFISRTLDAEVFAYKDPEVPGVCYALPRRNGTSIELLGIICQSATTGKACFWDNKTADGTPITGPDITLDIDTIGNGMNLKENCTSCHRGDNVFNIHPGTALDLSRANAPGGPYVTDIFDPNGTQIRYTPIGQPNWSNPEPLFLAPPSQGQRSCTGCHSIPQISPEYCSSVLRMAALGTMPPFGASRANWPPGPPPVNPKFADHIGLLSRCFLNGQ
jgi:hypothetical protein